MRPYASRFAVLITAVLVVLGCKAEPTEPDLRQRLQSMLDLLVQHHLAVRSAALHVDAPRIGLVWESAAGMADPMSGTRMTAGTPVRIACNTKTFVAAAVLRLHEKGMLDIFDPIADHLPAEYTAILESDGYDTEAMTIRHLLNHTSGLFDHTTASRYTDAFMADPTHRWTRTEQIRGAVDWGDPHGEPGEYYTYCDTGYVLLGAIIEQASGQPLAVAVRELLHFERLGLMSTWWEVFEPRPAWIPERAHQFYGDTDTVNFDPSFDLYGGGGLVSTVGDLARFYRALLTGEVFDDFTTGTLMLARDHAAQALPDADERALPPGDYRMGIWEDEVEGFVTYRHSGFFGTVAVYVPDLDLVVAATTNQNQDEGARNYLVDTTIDIVAEASWRSLGRPEVDSSEP